MSILRNQLQLPDKMLESIRRATQLFDITLHDGCYDVRLFDLLTYETHSDRLVWLLYHVMLDNQLFTVDEIVEFFEHEKNQLHLLNYLNHMLMLRCVGYTNQLDHQYKRDVVHEMMIDYFDQQDGNVSNYEIYQIEAFDERHLPIKTSDDHTFSNSILVKMCLAYDMGFDVAMIIEKLLKQLHKDYDKPAMIQSYNDEILDCMASLYLLTLDSTGHYFEISVQLRNARCYHPTIIRVIKELRESGQLYRKKRIKT